MTCLLYKPRLFKSWLALYTGQITIQRTSKREANCTMNWKEIYPANSVTHLLNNWGLREKMKISLNVQSGYRLTHLILHEAVSCVYVFQDRLPDLGFLVKELSLAKNTWTMTFLPLQLRNTLWPRIKESSLWFALISFYSLFLQPYSSIHA